MQHCFKFVIATLLLGIPFLVQCTDLNEHTAFLLNCPIRRAEDFEYLLRLSEEEGHPIDIFQEKVASPHSVVQLLTDKATSKLLLGQAGCYEEKGHAAVRRLFPKPHKTPEYSEEHFHADYRPYSHINRQLHHYHHKYPHLVKSVESIGKSQEGRDLMVIHITAAAQLGTKPVVWIMGGQHAREWIATAAVMVFIEQLLKSSSTLLLNYEFAVLPLANPDGYEFSRTSNRMWRKNRGIPHPVDLNRNWDHKWCEIGSSKSPKSDSYCGPGAASEPEIDAAQKYILSLPQRAIGFDIHSYGQMVLRNYGWTNAPSPNENITMVLSNKMVQAMLAVDQVQYDPMRSSALYPVSGSAEDWFYVKAGMHGFVLELRDQGRYGFLLPAAQIIPTGKELFAAITTALHNL